MYGSKVKVEQKNTLIVNQRSMFVTGFAELTDVARSVQLSIGCVCDTQYTDTATEKWQKKVSC